MTDLPSDVESGPKSVVLHSVTAKVYLEYDDPATVPPLLETDHGKEGGWTRFVCISDTHSKTFEVPDGDVLLHSGDLTKIGRYVDLLKTMEWLYELPHKVKILIAGNHDLPLHRSWYPEENWARFHDDKEDYDKVVELLTGDRAKEAGIVYLENTTHTFSLRPGSREWSVYGSPWTPYFYDWAFNYKRDTSEELIASFPKTDILLTHGPPQGIFDYTMTGEFVGCSSLSSRIASGELRPRLHAFGHIHESRGAHIHSWEALDAPCKGPTAQSPFYDEDTEDDMFDDSGDQEAVKAHAEVDKDKSADDETNQREDLERTVFVNAANQPTGRGTWRGGIKIPFGGPGFRPIIVDIRD